MKRIIFVIQNLKTGGIQKSLLELLKQIAPYYDITLYCPNFEGQYIADLPQSIHTVSGGRFAKVAEWSVDALRGMGFWYFLCRVVFVQWSRWFGRKIPAYIYAKCIGFPKASYDWAISYAQPLESHQFEILTNEIVLYAAQAKHKASFLHADYQNYGGNTAYSKWLYQHFDKIAAVSESVRNGLVSVLPEFSDKTLVVYNACDAEQVKALANENSVQYAKKCLVSVSRLSEEKGLMRCLSIIERLRDEGHDFEWHLLGDGPEKNKILAYVEEHQLGEVVFLEGNQENPYRYMRNADFLLLPSLHEAAPMVFNEAEVLNLPILTTDTLSAKELVADRQLGRVCSNDEKGIYEMLQEALTKGVARPQGNTHHKRNEEVVAQFKKMIEDAL
jgi:glycosyltransferase involved in cell wall biosynthesis